MPLADTADVKSDLSIHLEEGMGDRNNLRMNAVAGTSSRVQATEVVMITTL